MSSSTCARQTGTYVSPSRHLLTRIAHSRDLQTAYVRTSVNLPAQSFHQSIPALLPLFSKVPLVIFYCKACTIVSRGARAASYYQDALNAAGIKTSEARILTGGIQGWIAKYGEDEKLTVKLQ